MDFAAENDRVDEAEAANRRFVRVSKGGDAYGVRVQESLRFDVEMTCGQPSEFLVRILGAYFEHDLSLRIVNGGRHRVASLALDNDEVAAIGRPENPGCGCEFN